MTPAPARLTAIVRTEACLPGDPSRARAMNAPDTNRVRVTHSGLKRRHEMQPLREVGRTCVVGRATGERPFWPRPQMTETVLTLPTYIGASLEHWGGRREVQAR